MESEVRLAAWEFGFDLDGVLHVTSAGTVALATIIEPSWLVLSLSEYAEDGRDVSFCKWNNSCGSGARTKYRDGSLEGSRRYARWVSSLWIHGSGNWMVRMKVESVRKKAGASAGERRLDSRQAVLRARTAQERWKFCTEIQLV